VQPAGQLDAGPQQVTSTSGAGAGAARGFAAAKARKVARTAASFVNCMIAVC